MYAIIDKLLFMGILTVIAVFLWHIVPFDYKEGSNEAKPEAAPVAKVVQPEVAPVTTVQQHIDPAVEGRLEVTASPLFVRQVGNKATLIVRHRARKQACTGLLLIWSGAKRKRISDSFYDLGIVQAEEVTEAVVEEFMAMSVTRLDELATAGRKKRKTEAAEEVAVQQQEVVAAVAETTSVETAPAASVEDTVQDPVAVDDSPRESVKLRKFPDLFRGIIKEVGMMRQNKNGREFDTFGVVIETQEGIVEAVFGAHLRTALREANASVGDPVEILKIGRKTIEKGRAPMNLFQVAKLQQKAA